MFAGMHAHANASVSSWGPAPTYHPSLVPRGKAGSPHAPDGGLQPTSPEAFEELLKQLKTNRRTLEARHCHLCNLYTAQALFAELCTY